MTQSFEIPDDEDPEEYLSHLIEKQEKNIYDLIDEIENINKEAEFYNSDEYKKNFAELLLQKASMKANTEELNKAQKALVEYAGKLDKSLKQCAKASSEMDVFNFYLELINENLEKMLNQ
jgi:GTPase involved in cell partitioning and DNA repair